MFARVVWACLEQKNLAPSTINVRLAAVRRLAHEAADTGLLSPELAAGIGRVTGAKRLIALLFTTRFVFNDALRCFGLRSFDARRRGWNFGDCKHSGSNGTRATRRHHRPHRGSQGRVDLVLPRSACNDGYAFFQPALIRVDLSKYLKLSRNGIRGDRSASSVLVQRISSNGTSVPSRRASRIISDKALTRLGNNHQDRQSNLPEHPRAWLRKLPDVYWALLKERYQSTCAKHYSYLSATMGSTRIARRAGI